MKVFTNFLSSLLVAVWLCAIAVIAIQNVQAVSLKFLIWQSIQFPFGVLLAFCAGIGFISGSLVPLLWSKR